MSYLFPFGQEVHALRQEDQTPKKIFVLGVYASAVHARWKRDGKVICQAMAVASEPRIFWDGNVEEAKEIISKVKIPAELGILEPANQNLNGPSAKVLDNDILAPLGFTRDDAWLCDLLPETRINPHQLEVITERYNPLIKEYNLNEVTIPVCPTKFCDEKRTQEITDEILRSEADILVVLGDVPIKQYINQVADVDYKSLLEYTNKYGYGNPTDITIANKTLKLIPLAHPRQIGALGAHSEHWKQAHEEWEVEHGII